MKDCPKKLSSFSIETTIMSKHLPQEVVEQILFQLPIKSLVRFSSVSKEVYEIITRFKPLANHTLLLLDVSHARNDYVFRLLNDGTFQEYAMYVWYDDEGLLVDNKNTKKHDFHCYGNGLICFYNDDDRRVTLWNPFIRRSLVLPKSTVLSMEDKRCTFGIVVDRVTDDYKILRTDTSMLIDWLELGTKVEIFRLSRGCWEVLDCTCPFAYLNPHQVDMKGMSYWIGVDSYFDLILVWFDGHVESFGSVKIDVPGMAYAGTYWLECLNYIFLFNESLVLIYSEEVEDDSSVDHDLIIRSANNIDYEDEDYYYALYTGGIFWGPREFESIYRIWKMDDCEGKSLNLWRTISFDERARPLGFRENGELLWLVDRTKLISTDLDTGSHTCLGYDNADRISSCPNYVESLALWNKKIRT